MRILLLENLTKSASLNRIELENVGFLADIAAPENLRDCLRTCRYGLVVIDLLHPETDYFFVLQDVTRRSDAPILILSPPDKLFRRMEGLKFGVTHYLVKPFSSREFVAKVKSLMRHRLPSFSDTLRLADLEVDLLHRKARRGQITLSLSAKEFSLLVFLLQNQGRIVSTSALAEHLWGANAQGLSNVVEVTVGRLRRKLEQPSDINFLHTVRGLGYVLEVRPPNWP